MTEVQVCSVPDELLDTLKKFRFRKAKNNGAVIMKVDQAAMTIVVDEELDDTTLEAVVEELPDFQPRFVVYSFVHTHSDGRISYPMVFIYYAPLGAKPEHNMIYTGSRHLLQKTIQVTKIFDVRSKDDLTQEWLDEHMGFFK